MPLTKEEIKLQHKVRNRDAAAPPPWVSPHYGDGGWHNTPGTNRYTTEWEPLGDRILVELFDDAPRTELIVRPEIVEGDKLTRRGIVLKVGTGKRDGEGGRVPFAVKPGDEVIIGRWTDWESNEAGWGQNVVICMEADVRAKLHTKGVTCIR